MLLRLHAPIKIAKKKMPQSHIIPMKSIWDGLSFSGLGFMPQLGLRRDSNSDIYVLIDL